MTMDSPSTTWELPEPSMTVDVAVDAGTFIKLRRHGNANGPRLVLSHGNGLAIDLYYPFWSRLTDDFDVIIHDLRNHGQNELGPIQSHNLPTLALDHDLVSEAIDAHFGSKPKVGVYHSIASLAALLAPGNGSGFSAVVLFDPPLRKPGVLHEDFDDAAIQKAAQARRRTAHFQSKEQFTNLAGFSPAFARVLPGVIDLAAETTLRESPDGEGFDLRCPPEYEAQIVEYARIFNAFIDLSTYGCPLKVIGADPTLPFSFLPTLDLGDMLGTDYDFLPDATHLLQMEQPEQCVSAMLAFLEREDCL